MEETDEIYVIEGGLLESIRFRQGGWRFYFPGSELSVWGEAILQVMGRELTMLSPDFFARLQALLGSEVTNVRMDTESLTLSFGPNHLLRVLSDEEGEFATLLLQRRREVTIWNRTPDGNLVRSTGSPGAFD